MAGRRTVVVFDFDRTLITGDSDDWVVTHMGISPLFHQLLPSLPWNSLMVISLSLPTLFSDHYSGEIQDSSIVESYLDRMMEELHSQGKTTEDIAGCLRPTPIHPRTVSAIKAAHALGCDLRIISDANQFFIEKILEGYGLLECFSHVSTNPTIVDADGRLRIFPYHDSSKPPHGCTLCPPNMCKGLIIDQMYAAIDQGERRRFIYLGDGKGDFCPSLRLKKGDFVMPRTGYSLSDCIRSNQKLVKAEVLEWNDGEELESILLSLIRRGID